MHNTNDVRDYRELLEISHSKGRFRFKNALDICVHGRLQGVEIGICLPPEDWDYDPKISRKSEVRNLIPINWFNSWIGSLFADITLTLHKSQVHYSGFMQWWICSSIMSTLFSAEAGCETGKRIVLSLVFTACVTITCNKPSKVHFK